MEFRVASNSEGAFVAEAFKPGRGTMYVTPPHATSGEAVRAAQAWATWYAEVSRGRGQSIYYVLAVPETWAGPPPGRHPYFGLRVKIGRATDIRKRVRNLQTGTPERLILHALEPGGASLERARHQQFASDRRQGEWFACSPPLAEHMIEVWSHFRVLMPEHQEEIMRLCERIEILKSVRKVFDGPPELINPSLNEPWNAKTVLIDLVHGFRPKE